MVGEQVVTGRKFKQYLTILFSLILIFVGQTKAYAEEIPSKPENNIYDTQQFLSENVIEKLKEHNSKSDIKMAVFVYDDASTNNTNKSEEISKEWAIGSKAENDSVLILINIANKTIYIDISPTLKKKLTEDNVKEIQTKAQENMNQKYYTTAVNYVASTFENLPTGDNTLTPPTEVRDRMDIQDSIWLTKKILGWVGIFFAITIGLGSVSFILMWLLLFKLFGVKSDRIVGPYYYDVDYKKWRAETNYTPPSGWSYTKFNNRGDEYIYEEPYT